MRLRLTSPICMISNCTRICGAESLTGHMPIKATAWRAQLLRKSCMHGFSSMSKCKTHAAYTIRPFRWSRILFAAFQMRAFPTTEMFQPAFLAKAQYTDGCSARLSLARALYMRSNIPSGPGPADQMKADIKLARLHKAKLWSCHAKESKTQG